MKASVSAAEDAETPALPESSNFYQKEAPYEKALVRLSLDFFFYLPGSGVFQHPFCLALIDLFYHSTAHLNHRRKQGVL